MSWRAILKLYHKTPHTPPIKLENIVRSLKYDK